MFGVKGFTSVAKPRKYQYVPRFWNPDKEAWEKKKEEYRARGYDYGDDETYTPGKLIKRNKLHKVINSEKSKQDRMALCIRLISFCFLVVILYMLYKFFF